MILPKTETEVQAYMAEYDRKMGKKPSYLDVMGHEHLTGGPHKADEGPESKLQGKIMAWAKEQGYPIFHDRSRGKNQRGWPDCFLYLPEGRHVLIELKSAKGHLRKEQKELKQRLIYLGFEYYKVNSFKQFLEIANER